MDKTKLMTIVIVFFTLTSYSQIVNEGVFVIANGSVFSSAYEFTNKTGAKMTNQGTLHFNSNFINNGIMTASSNADLATGLAYFDSSTNTTQTISGTNKVVFENMVVQLKNATSKGVLVADGMDLVIENKLTLNKGDLQLLGKAQLLQNHSGRSSNTGMANLIKNQQKIINNYSYQYWSSPVSPMNTTLFAIDDVLYNNSKSIDSESLTIYKFRNGDPNVNTSWTVVNGNGTLNPYEGYTMKSTKVLGAQNNVFKGVPNNGSFTFPIGIDRSYLLGNPYPSGMDANKFIIDNLNSITGAVYYWESLSNDPSNIKASHGGYATYTLAGGTPAPSLLNGNSAPTKVNASRYIPIAKGFFVKSKTGGNITINNSQRTFKIDSTDSKSADTTAQSISRIRLAYQNSNGYYRQIMTAFIPEMTTNFNPGYNAIMADFQPDDMYWSIEDTRCVIDARSFNENDRIPLGIRVNTSGIHKITLVKTEAFDKDIYLFDSNTQTSYDLRKSIFEVRLPKGTYTHRFYLVFKPQSKINAEEVKNKLQVFYLNTEKQIVIKKSKNSIINKVRIFNSMGQLIKNITVSKKNNSKELRLPFNGNNGVYIVNLDTSIGRRTQKIIIE